MMAAKWFEAVSSAIPRGFSRHIVLEMISVEPMTGKQIIDAAADRTKNEWRPSPGLIYPLLGRLAAEGLIEQDDDGRYCITKKGRRMASDVEAVNAAIKRQLDTVFRLSEAGKFVAADVLERMAMMGGILRDRAQEAGKDQAKKYKEFLESELDRLKDGKD